MIVCELLFEYLKPKWSHGIRIMSAELCCLTLDGRENLQHDFGLSDETCQAYSLSCAAGWSGHMPKVSFLIISVSYAINRELEENKKKLFSPCISAAKIPMVMSSNMYGRWEVWEPLFLVSQRLIIFFGNVWVMKDEFHGLWRNVIQSQSKESRSAQKKL